MYYYKYKAADPASLMVLAYDIERVCQSGDVFEIRLAGKGYAAFLQSWHFEAERLTRKLLSPPRIRVSRNCESADQHILITNREVIMSTNVIKECFSRIKSFLNAEDCSEIIKEENQNAQVDNILYSAIKDNLAEHNQNMAGHKRATRYITRFVISPQTVEARLYVEKLLQYGILEEGIIDFVRNDFAGQWPLIKPSANMTVEICDYDETESGRQPSDFSINSTFTAAVQGVSRTSKNASSGKKAVRYPFTITVDGKTQEIKTLPWRINKAEVGPFADTSLAGHPYVSGSHLLLDYENDNIVLIDLKSKNGSYIDGNDLRRNNGMKYVIKPGTTTVDLCLGNNPNDVEINKTSNDRKKFPRLVIEYGAPSVDSETPETPELHGTPELNDFGTPELAVAGHW